MEEVAMTEYQELQNVLKRSPDFLDFQKPDSDVIYQYRSFKSFLSILKSDCFWATNARFSNDDEEQRFVTEILEVPLCKQRIHIDSKSIDENYIVCFCRDRDKLSQWRGYAPEGGVSIGFAFPGPVPFYVKASNTREHGAPAISDKAFYVQAEPVVYISPRKNSASEEQYYRTCFETMHFTFPNITLGSKDREKIYDEICTKAPYVKHSGFSEESELRLVFPNADGFFDSYIQYRGSEEELIKTPYIEVHAGLPQRNEYPCVIRVCVENIEKGDNLVSQLCENLNDLHVEVENCVDHTKGELQDSFCAGCTVRHWIGIDSMNHCRGAYSNPNRDDYDYQLGLSTHENSIIISQGTGQEAVFNRVYPIVQEFSEKSSDEDKIKVWCEGHLPVRSITVGPSPNQSTIIEYIQHYCRHTYWLRDVDIYASDIPYRRSTV